MRKFALWLLAILFILPVAWAATVSQRTEGQCSPAVLVGKGNVRIECKGVDRDQVNHLVKIFNEGLRNFQEFQKQMLERQPDINIRCNTDQQGDPSKILCSVTNNGRGEARDLLISFADLLPVDTIVQAPQSLDLESKKPVHPQTQKIVQFPPNF